MLSEIKHLPVNWIDGMKISKSHFVASDDAIYDHIRDSIGIQLKSYNFGLLPPVPGTDSSLELKVTVDQNQQLNVNLLKCRAITQGGVRIELIGKSIERIETALGTLEGLYDLGDGEKHLLDVVLSVDTTTKIAVGEPDPAETPPRHPFTKPVVKIEIIKTGELNFKEVWPNHILIGQYEIENDKVNISNNFIPACTAVNAHPDLLSAYYNFGNLMDGVGAKAIKIVQKIKSRDQEDTLAKNVHEVAKCVVYFLAENMGIYRFTISENPPIFMISFFIQLAHLIKTCIFCMPVNEKEELISYFSDWSNLSPGAFEKILDETISMEYEHRQIGNAILKLNTLTETIGSLFEKLSDLDYIGKSKKQVAQNANLLVEEESTKTKKKGWGF